jgi:DNA-directed RNA polymerase subunit E'/Rpb7
MPTAAKLFAAFAFTFVAFFTAQMVMPYMPDGTQFGAFVPISMIIGLVAGWRVMGPAVGKGNYAAAGSGMKTSLVLTLFALFVFSTYQMVENALRKQYDGPMDAVVGIVAIAIEWGALLIKPDVLTVLLIGGALGGLLSEWADRRWS